MMIDDDDDDDGGGVGDVIRQIPTNEIIWKKYNSRKEENDTKC